MAESNRSVQAWIELVAEDPEVFSAFSVARARLEAGRGLVRLGRARLVELSGCRAGRDRVAELLHASTQFYNPHKERCTLRLRPEDPLPAPAGARLVLVYERGGARRPAAERWWRYETGESVQVREGVVWALEFAPGVDASAAARELEEVRDARLGLFCNPYSQEHKQSEVPPPHDWIGGGPDEPGREGGLP